MIYFVIACLNFVLWGLFPLYFNLIKEVESLQTTGHRVIWSLVFNGLIILLFRKRLIRPDRLKRYFFSRQLFYGMIASCLIIINWLVFVIAVNEGKIIETSMGYFTSPLLTVFLGIVILKEKVSSYRIIAIIIAVIALLYKFSHEEIRSFVPLILGGTFSAYGFVKKKIELNTVTAFFIECFWMIPLTAGFLFLIDYRPEKFFFDFSFQIAILLIFSGIVTTTPLLLFHFSVKKIDLNLVGLIQYISPITSLVSAVLIMGEQFKPEEKVVFPLIWLSIMLICWEGFRNWKRSKKLKKARIQEKAENEIISEVGNI